jgi:hypothetical protein
MADSVASPFGTATLEQLVVWLYVAIGLRLLWHTGWRHGAKALWITKSSITLVAAGLLAFFNVSPLRSTLWFCLQFPIFPLFSELSRSNGALGGLYEYAPSLLVMYWQFLGWIISNLPEGALYRKWADDVVFLLMWIALVKGTRFTKGFDVVKGVHKSGWRDARNSVFFACVPSLVMRYWPYPGPTVSLWVHVVYHLCFAYALYSTIVFLVAAQADDQGFRASYRLIWGFIPTAAWVPAMERQQARSSILLGQPRAG